ncbi:MAG: hypothetical protein M3Z30_03395 [Gemmatimonadota bacterium]|nr:hypothetical protein [Gemmatimonadota bacterium]
MRTPLLSVTRCGSRFAASAILVIALGAALAAPRILQGQKPADRPAEKPAEKAAAGMPEGSFNVVADAAMRSAPGAEVVGDVRKSANVAVLARDRGWARVRIEAWVPDSVLAPADASYRANLSAADLRADPAAARGKTVVWNVEYLALQTADPLRHGLADEEPYMLARGPNTENALLYLVVPPSLMGTVRALKPLARITVTARVRDGKSDPVGVPILDVETISRIR